MTKQDSEQIPKTSDIEKLEKYSSEIKNEFDSLVRDKILIEEEAEEVVQEPKEVAEETKDEAIKEPSAELVEEAKKEIIEELKEDLKDELKELKEELKEEIAEPAPEIFEKVKSTPKPLTPELIQKPDVGSWTESVKQIRYALNQEMKSQDDLMRFFETNKLKLKNNPLVRKAFLLNLRDGLKLDDEFIEAEILSPMEDLVGAPLFDIENLIQDHVGKKEFKKFKKNLKDATGRQEKSRKEAIKKINLKLSELSEKYFDALIENDRAVQELVDKFEDKFPKLEKLRKKSLDKAIEYLKDKIFPKNKLNEALEEALETGEFLATGTRMIVSGSNMVILHNDIVELQNKLKLVKEGFLVNPTV